MTVWQNDKLRKSAKFTRRIPFLHAEYAEYVLNMQKNVQENMAK